VTPIPLEITLAPIREQPATGSNRRQPRNANVAIRHGLIAKSSQASL